MRVFYRKESFPSNESDTVMFIEFIFLLAYVGVGLRQRCELSPLFFILCFLDNKTYLIIRRSVIF